MNFKEPFGKLLSVATVLIFFLSVSVIDLHASEQGNGLPFGTPHFSYNQLSSIQNNGFRPRVAGYEVKTATTTSTTPFIFSNITQKNNINYTALISWTTNLDAKVQGLSWYEAGSNELYWHWYGSGHVTASKTHSLQLGDGSSWALHNGSQYFYQVCNATTGSEPTECSGAYSFYYTGGAATGDYDLAIVSGEATSSGFRFNFCNNGDAVTSFPVSIYVDATVRTFDLSGLYAAHTCQAHTWDYGVWGLNNPAGNTYSVEVDVDINRTIDETNESNNTTQQRLTVPNITSTAQPDVAVTNIQVQSRVNQYDPADKYEIVVTIKNNGFVALPQYDLLRSTLLLTAGTNITDITNCGVGTCNMIGNSYNAGMYLSAMPIASIPAGGSQDYVFNQQTYIGTRPSFEDNVPYAIKAIVDNNGYFAESEETNNVKMISYTAARASTQCAGPGLRADIYGGPSQVCCAGLVLQGGICNNPAQSQNKTVAVVSPNGGEAYVQGSSITVSWSGARNWVIVGLVEGSATSATIPSTNSSLPLLGWIKQSNDASGSVTWDGKQVCDLLLTTCWPVKPGQYKIVASSKDLIGNTTLWNADANFDLSDGMFTITAPTVTEKISICHRNSGVNTYTELSISKDAWVTAHKVHAGDFIKTGEGTCAIIASKNSVVPFTQGAVDGPRNIPGLTTKPQAVTTEEITKDAIIRKLQDRIQKLELKLTELEQQVTQREVDRQTTTDAKLTKRLEGKLLLQPQEHGEVWWVLPDVGQKIYLQNGEGAYEAMRAFGLGISEKDFSNIKVLGKNLKGKVILRVQANGEAYYIDDTGAPQYLKNGDAAYQIMKDQALGVSNSDLSKIPTGDFFGGTASNQ